MEKFGTPDRKCASARGALVPQGKASIATKGGAGWSADWMSSRMNFPKLQ
jgi:hypothetical protein